MRRLTLRLAGTVFAVMFLVAGLPPLRSQTADRSPAQHQEMQDFRQFLAAHPWIANKLRENPSLANNKGFLHDNPELPQFLDAHPFVQSSFRTDANGVMSRAQQGGMRFENLQEAKEMQDFQQFLSNHPWIAGKLRENPKLANEEGFLKGNHELPQFLSSHPYVKSQFRADPNGFMDRARAVEVGDAYQNAYDPHASEYEALKLFMEGHKWIGNQLKDKPSRATNADFLKDNKELRDFLQAHPFLQDQFRQDPNRTVDRALQSVGQAF